MKNLLKKYKIRIGISVFIYLVFLGLFTFKLNNYELMTVGPIDHVKTDEIIVDTNYEEQGSLNTVAVYTYEKPSIAMFIVNYFFKEVELIKRDDNYSFVRAKIASSVSKDMSITNSILLSYKEAGLIDNLKYYTTPVIYRALIDSPYPNAQLPLGSEGSIVLKVNDKEVTNLEEFRTEISTKDCTKTFNLLLNVNNNLVNYDLKFTEMTVNEELVCISGLYAYDKVTITESYPKVTIDRKPNTYGGSGGLMQTLAVYNQLVEEDITKGKKIVGTGTIDLNGNVGPIGGAFQKFHSAHYAKADIFIVLDDSESKTTNNYAEVLRAKKYLNSNVEVVAVKTFEEAVNYLKNMR